MRQSLVGRARRCASRAWGYQSHVALETGFGQPILIVVQCQGATHEPGLGELRPLGGDQVELGGGFRVATAINQGAGIVHSEFRLWLAVEVFFHQGFCRGLPGCHERQCEQGGALRFGIKRLSLARGVQCGAAIAGLHPQTTNGGPGGNADGGCTEVLGQRLLCCLGGSFFVAGTCKVARNGGDCERSVLSLGIGNFALERLYGLGQPVHADQDLKRVPVGLTRVGQRLTPGACCLQRRVTRSGLERDLNRALVQPWVDGLAGGIQYE